jgi:shikimate kinase
MTKSKELNLTKPIALVGLMGVGKTTLGKKLANTLDVPFLDTDQIVERYVGCSIKEIYKYQGEYYFQRMESMVLEKILEQDQPMVISTGGTTFLNDENIELIRQKAASVWLQASKDVIISRVSRRDTRPIFNRCKNKSELVDKLMEEHNSKYEMADIDIKTTDQPKRIIVSEIIEKLQNKNIV